MFYRFKSLSLMSLVLCFIFPMSVWKPLQASQTLAQSFDAESQADQLVKKGEELVDQGRSEVALPLFEQALAIYRKINNHRGEAQTLKGIGNVYYDLKDYQRSLSSQQQALKIAQVINDKDLQARTLSNIGNAYRALGDINQAISFYQQSLAVARQIKNRQIEANTLENLGYAYFSIDVKKAISFLEQSLVALRQVGGSPQEQLRQRQQEADILISVGRNYFILHQAQGVQGEGQGKPILDKSIQAYQQALNIAKQIGIPAQQGEIFLGLGRSYNSQSQYLQALKSFQQAVQAFQQDQKSRVRLGEALASLGEVYKNLGKRPEALQAYQQALEIAKVQPANNPEDRLTQANQQGLILASISDIYTDAGKYQEALKNYQDSLEIYKSVLALVEKVPNASNKPYVQIQVSQANFGVKYTCTKIANVYALLGQASQGLEGLKACSPNSQSPTVAQKPIDQSSTELVKAQEDLALAQRLGKRELEAFALASIGDAYTKLNQSDRALENYQKAVALAKVVGNPQVHAHTLYKLGQFYDKKQNYAQAINSYQQAVVAAKKSNDKVVIGPILTQLGAVQFQAGKLADASKSLYEAIALYESLRAGLTDQNKISIFEIQAYTYRLLQQTLITQNQPEAALEVAERGRARAFVELLASKLSASSQTPANSKPLSIEQIKQIAKRQNATLVEYSVIGNDAIYIWVVQPTGKIAFRQVDLKAQKISLPELVKTSRESLGVKGRGIIEVAVVDNSSQQQKQKLQQLYQLLITPIASLLPTNPNQRVIFIPHESLFLVPFAALQDTNGKYLIEKHTILTAPAIQVLDLTTKPKQQSRGKQVKEVLVMGNPTMPKLEPPLQPLPGSEKEAQAIAQLENTTAIIGAQATETLLKQKLPNAKIVHLATHGLLESPQDKTIPTAIALAPSPKDDGLLTPAEIVDLPIKAEMVVLSACDTGRGKITGDGVIGLSRSLMTAGASSVVVSLWAVPDAPTSGLMTEFYHNLQQNPDKAVALRNAILTTMKRHPNPVNWAAFTLIGKSS
ncbi:MAG: Fis family transcriptional regulator [Mastigocladus sp. ERB_26_2]